MGESNHRSRSTEASRPICDRRPPTCSSYLAVLFDIVYPIVLLRLLLLLLFSAIAIAASSASDIGAATATATYSASRGTGHFVGRSASKVTGGVAAEQTGENLGHESRAKSPSVAPDMRSWLDDDSDSGSEAGGALADGDGGSWDSGRLRSQSRSSGNMRT